MRRTLFLILMPIHYIIGLPYFLVLTLFKLINHDKAVALAYQYNRLTAWLMFFCSGATFEVEGLEHISEPDACLYVGNHRSMLDITLMLKYIKEPAVFMGKESVSKWPVIAWWMRLQDTIFVDRNSPREGMKAVKRAIEYLKAGRSIILFPEGTRSKTADMLPFKKGSVRMAQKAGVPIVPIAIKGTDDVFENNGFNLKAGLIQCKVGKPIDLNDVELKDDQTYSEYIRSVIQDMYHSFK